MKSPNSKENKNTGGQKFQNRQPGEKRSRIKNDTPKPSNRPAKTEGIKPNRSASPRSGAPRSFNSDGNFERKSSGQRNFRSERPSETGQRSPFNRQRTIRNNREDADFRGDRTARKEGNSNYRSAEKKSFGSRTGGQPSGGYTSSKPGGYNRNSDNRNNEFGRKSEGYSGKRSASNDKFGSEARPNRFSGKKPGYSSTNHSREDGFIKKSSYRSDFQSSTGRTNSDDSRNSKFGSRTASTQRGASPSKFNSRNAAGDGDSIRKVRQTKKKDNFQETPKSYKGSRKIYGKVQQQQEQSLLSGEDMVRLNRFIANSGICSRREADELISQGLVKVNGQVVTELGTKVKPTDVVKVEDKKVTPEKPVYILLNKPKGYITSTSDPDGRQTVLDLIDLPGKERIYPVGRLDRNTTGVLLLTNDGELSQKLMHPSFEIKKIYRATVDKRPTKEHMLAWVEGVELEDGWMTFEQIGWVEEGEENVLGIEIKSGRNRIVRRMFEHFGYEVVSLDRVMLGDFDKLKLGRGKWRFLSEKEMRYIERIKRMQ